MKKYTVEDLKNFEKDECGYLICPTGDYTEIKSFGEGCRFGEGCSFGVHCSFGEWCSFGEGCSFGEWCRFGEGCNLNNLKFENMDIPTEEVLKIDRIGSRKGCTYFFKTAENIFVRCGCFFGTLSEFAEKVEETHGDNKYGKEYKNAIEFAKKHFEVEE